MKFFNEVRTKMLLAVRCKKSKYPEILLNNCFISPMFKLFCSQHHLHELTMFRAFR